MEILIFLDLLLTPLSPTLIQTFFPSCQVNSPNCPTLSVYYYYYYCGVRCHQCHIFYFNLAGHFLCLETVRISCMKSLFFAFLEPHPCHCFGYIPVCVSMRRQVAKIEKISVTFADNTFSLL